MWIGGGLTTLVAREAVERVKQSARFMVTFRREPPSSTENAQLDAE